MQGAPTYVIKPRTLTNIQHFNRLSTCTYHKLPMTHHVDHAGAALGTCDDILNGTAKLVGLKLDEGPYILNINWP
jgi:hypothetical protein